MIHLGPSHACTATLLDRLSINIEHRGAGSIIQYGVLRTIVVVLESNTCSTGSRQKESSLNVPISSSMDVEEVAVVSTVSAAKER